MEWKSVKHFEAVHALVLAHGGKWPRSMTSGVMFWNGERVELREFVSCAGKLEFYDDTNN